MARKSYIQIGGKLYDKAELSAQEQTHAPAILGDVDSFVSPIDGSVVRGRAGLREHCKKHNVVPTADLKGLPVGRPSYEPDRAAIRESLKRQFYKG